MEGHGPIRLIPLSVIYVALALLAFVVYYFVFVAMKSLVYCGNRNFPEFILQYSKSARSEYWPTFWCFTARAQTILRAVLTISPNVLYYKELLDLSDGGVVALDWGLRRQPKDTDIPWPYLIESQPIVVLLPGLTGSSKDVYVQRLVNKVINTGYRCVVFNNRGNGDVSLRTPRTYCAASTDDLREVVLHICKSYPDAPLLAVGVSLGGIILLNYLADFGYSSGMVAAFTVSAPWNMFESSKSLESCLNRILFNRHLCNNLVNMIEKYQNLFSSDNYDFAQIRQATRIRDFDDYFIAKQFGYSGWKEYYEMASADKKIKLIRTPLVALNAADDPFAPLHSLPLKDASENQFVLMLVSKHGGHIGFLQGILPFKDSYMEKVCGEYIRAVFEHLPQFRKLFPQGEMHLE